MSGNVYYFYRVRILISCLTLYFISLISTPYIFNTNKQKSLTKCSKLLYFLYNFVFFCIFANVMNDCQKHERANKQHACLQNAGFHYNISFFATNSDNEFLNSCSNVQGSATYCITFLYSFLVSVGYPYCDHVAFFHRGARYSRGFNDTLIEVKYC